jgi:glucokinase
MYNIGIDLGGTNIAAAIVDEKGQIIVKGSEPTKRERDYTEIVKDMALLALELINKQGLTNKDIHSVGIGSPGTPDTEKGLIVYANNLKFKNTPIREEFNKYFEIPVYIENDANAAAYGEFVAGVGNKYSDFVAVTLGTGVGSGVIVNNKIITGSYHGGAELGHMVIKMGGSTCSCGRKGCWEEYSSATALIREAKKEASVHPDSMLNKLVEGDLDKMNAKIPFDAAQAGDEVAIRLIDWYIEHLAVGLVNLINIFQPQAIALGGGVSAQRDNLIKPLKEKMIHEIYGGEEALNTELLVCELGNEAGIIGAAMLYKLYDK